MKNIILTLLVVAALFAGIYIGRMDTRDESSEASSGGADKPDTAQTAPGILDFAQFQIGPRNVKDIYADDDYMWIGTSGGAIRFDPENQEYQVYDNTLGLLANGVFAVGRINGRIALGTYGGGLSLLQDNDQWKIYNVPEGLGDAFVYDFLTMPNGDVWIATWSGVNRVRQGRLDDPSAWDLYTVENTDGGLPNDWVYGLHAGPDDTVWLATEGGLAHFDGKRWENWNHSDGLGAELVEDSSIAAQSDRDPANFSRHHARQKVEMGLTGIDAPYNPNYIVSLWVDEDGTVWAGTWGGGLSRLRDGEWTSFTTEQGLPGNHVFALYRDGRQRLWIGTSKGMALMTGEGQFAQYGTEDGLFAENVFSIVEDANDGLWFGSYGGVTWAMTVK